MAENYNPINLYKDQIYSLLKSSFLEELNRGKIVPFYEIMHSILEELGITGYRQDELIFFEQWYETVSSLSYLTNYIELEDCNEILVHSNCEVQFEVASNLKREHISNLSESDFQLSLETLCAKNGVNWNYSVPFASFLTTIEQKLFRATLTHFSISANKKSKMFLRKISKSFFPLKAYTCTAQTEIFLAEQLNSKKNIIISGSTGSGKTSLLKTLLNLIPKNEHIVILEDTHEICTDIPNFSNLLADDSKQQKNLKDYLAYALRMRPDRIVLGEIRSREIVPFIMAMNTGHKGLLSSVHADSAADTLTRMALLFSLFSENKGLSYQLVLELICKNIDYVIHMENKKITDIIKVLGSEGSNIYFDSVLCEIC